MEKQDIRRLAAARKKEFSETDLEEKSEKICSIIRRLPVYREARIVFAYMDLPGEVRMRRFIEKCWEQGKTVAVPKIMDPEKPGGSYPESGIVRRMRFYQINTFDQLEEGVMRIMEPVPEKCRCLDREETSLVIVPGVAFDLEHRRIGYGGGYYDRYLAQHPYHHTVAAAYRCQVFDRVPFEKQDICPQLLVTEEGLL